MKKSCLILTMVLCLLSAAALGDTISFNGTVEPAGTELIYAPLGGVVEEIPVEAGERVTADTVIAKIRTTKVYAPEDGTVTAVYGQAGDSAESVAEKYGAVMYLEGKDRYSISASTSRAYEIKENYIVHSGEKVYVVARNRTTYKGEGIITAVDGSSYTVLVTSGDFYVGDSMDIMRDEDYNQTSRIGRGNIERISPTAVTGTGSIVSYAVKAGESVKRGQLLFETVEGVPAGLEMKGTEILAGVDGVLAELKTEKGTTVTQDSVIATIYPRDAVRVAAQVPEADLKELSVGQKVKVELDWNQDQGVSYEGTVEMISSLGTVGEESTTYPVYVRFTPDENTRYSMTAMITTLEQDEAPAAETEAPEAGE